MGGHIAPSEEMKNAYNILIRHRFHVIVNLILIKQVFELLLKCLVLDF
jgi:hypothetical protein